MLDVSEVNSSLSNQVKTYKRHAAVVYYKHVKMDQKRKKLTACLSLIAKYHVTLPSATMLRLSQSIVLDFFNSSFVFGFMYVCIYACVITN